jgi:hypothetical protein
MILSLIGVVAALFVVTAPTHAQTGETPAITSFSQWLRANGFTLADQEAAFFDADEQVQAVYTISLTNVDLLSRADMNQRTDEWRQALIGELQRILATDPNGAPSAPPNLQPLRDLSVSQRTHMQRAARAWLDALQGGDPEWLARGGDEFRAGMQDLSNWQQELLARYPPPQAQP